MKTSWSSAESDRNILRARVANNKEEFSRVAKE
jgi:hypothetical protein